MQLEQHGVDSINALQDPEALMQIMDARELVEDTTAPAELQAMQQENKLEQERCLKVGCGSTLGCAL